MKVLITPRGFATYGLDDIKRMEDLGLEVDYNATGKSYDAATFLAKAKDADGIIVGVDDMHDTVLEQLPNLKVVCKYGVGTDNIGVDWCREHDVFVGRTVGCNSLSVAEHVAALMFCDAKVLYPAMRDVKDGAWNKTYGLELSGKTLGIVGFGAIGKLLASIANGIGMNVLAFDVMDIDPAVAEEHGVTIATFDEIIESADYVSVHVPLLDSTRGMIAAPQFKAMKSSACVINAARGGIVDEDDLYEALTTGEIRSAAFDTFSCEPPAAGTKLLELDNFLLTPHTAARTAESETRTCAKATDIIIEHLGL